MRKTNRSITRTDQGRRLVVTGGIAALVGVPLAPVAALARDRLIATPRQNRGPFYPETWTGDIDNDLVVLTGEEVRAVGRVLHIQGLVMDVYGRPLPQTKVEIWQADARGVYRHARDNVGGRRGDPWFQGRGRVRTGPDGSYSFRTIRPAPYPGRTPHIHFRIAAPKRRRLITQMYFADEPGNVRDPLLNAIRDPARRARLVVKPEHYDHVEPGAERVHFDVVIIGQ